MLCWQIFIQRLYCRFGCLFTTTTTGFPRGAVFLYECRGGAASEWGKGESSAKMRTEVFWCALVNNTHAIPAGANTDQGVDQQMGGDSEYSAGTERIYACINVNSFYICICEVFISLSRTCITKPNRWPYMCLGLWPHPATTTAILENNRDLNHCFVSISLL